MRGTAGPCDAPSSRSARISSSAVRPYPDFASTVVAPCASIARNRRCTASESSSRDAARVARTVARIPPPEAAIEA